jgi:hypothetical protein
LQEEADVSWHTGRPVKDPSADLKTSGHHLAFEKEVYPLGKAVEFLLPIPAAISDCAAMIR